MQISGKAAVGIAIVAVLLVAAYGTFVYTTITDWVPPWVEPTTTTTVVPPDTEFSSFKYSAVQKDATATGVTSATTRVWWDADGDGFMDYSEIGSFTESSGVYTSNDEYPIGEDFDLWVQVYASGYQVTYKSVYMTGQRNSDGTAKPAGEIELVKTDTGITYDGTINDVGWDDATDYNATLSGTSGPAEVKIVLSAADLGISSQVWDGVDYETIYGISRDMPFYVKWDQITDEGIADSSVMAPDFFGLTMAIADKVTLKPSVTDFDHYGDDDTNWYGLQVVTPDWGDLFYNTIDTSAPKPTTAMIVAKIGENVTVKRFSSEPRLVLEFSFLSAVGVFHKPMT